VSGWRRERRHADIERAERHLLLLPNDCCPDLEEVLIEQQWSEEVRAALTGLPETYRVPVFLKDVAGLAYREIAEVAGCPLGTVMSRLARGRALLRSALVRQARERGIVGARPGERAIR
jgi:RNA polymerase sigma factor (sigma-70 family)